MYSTQGLKSTGRGGSESKANYRMTHSLSMDETIKTIPKTENNMLSGIMNLFGSVGNIVSKIPNFMTSINNTLSVTVLPNSTITSEDLLRNLTGNTEHLSSDNKFGSTSSNYTGLITNSINNESQLHNQFIDENIIIQNTADWLKQFQDNQSNDLDIAIIESLKTMKEHKYYSDDETIIDTMDKNKIDLLNEKICTDKFGVDEMIIKINVPDSKDDNVDIELLAKKSLVTKSRRKCNVIAKSRRKKRGKVQLRKSGVSQMKHRKERIKHTLYSNIQDDLDDLPNNYNKHEINDRMSPIIDDESNLKTSYEIIPKYPSFSDTYVLDKSSKHKNWKDKKINKSEMLYKITILSNTFEDIGTPVTCKIRPRLISECSIGSDDLSIVFEDGSDSESDDENENSDYEPSSEDDESETETETEEETNCKVRFYLFLFLELLRYDFIHILY